MKPSYFRSIRFSIRTGINKGRSDAQGTEHLGYDCLPRGSLKLPPRFHPSIILNLPLQPAAIAAPPPFFDGAIYVNTR